jgi:hypothetical protein
MYQIFFDTYTYRSTKAQTHASEREKVVNHNSLYCNVIRLNYKPLLRRTFCNDSNWNIFLLDHKTDPTKLSQTLLPPGSSHAPICCFGVRRIFCVQTVKSSSFSFEILAFLWCSEYKAVIQVRIGSLFFLFREKRISIPMEFHHFCLQPEWKLKILGKQLCLMSGLFMWSTSATAKVHDQ